jgi:hypothetical protein
MRDGVGSIRNGRFMAILAATLTGRSWPIGEVHDRPLIQCTTSSSAASPEEAKRDAN